MGKSIRVKTSIGKDKTIPITLDQDFEQLEILSLTLRQEDIYIKDCANYGVIVGRVTANNGFGLPNARISVFIPLDSVDETNPIISSLYPYKSPKDKNEDGYRYNLLPYEKSFSKHAATGTFPSRNDVLIDNQAIEIYDKYYKFTVSTNDSGDYMIFGAPLGAQLLVMDVDLSDIGEFSLTPQDLIRMGLATEAQVAGSKFNTSTDLNSLPQLVNLTKTVEVSPLWGDQQVCQIAINRVDFDLRDDANIDIQPTAVFMGSIFSSPDKNRIRKNCKPKEATGNLCDLTTSPGQILAIRQTIQQDTNGNPILEEYQIEKSGNVIDGDGSWLLELPMNLDYYTTNEFGERIISFDPQIGIPTKAKYRFKIKWQQPNDLTLQTRRAYFLVPNVREYGWNQNVDPNIDPLATPQNQLKLKSSYYFGLDWSGYTEGFFGSQKLDRENDIITCEDTFYEFNFNSVYTVSGLIDQWKKGTNRGRFIGIKEIDNDDCSTSVNKFPVNDGVRNFDFLFFVFSILITIFQIIGIPILIAYHFIAFLWNNFAVPIIVYFIFNFGANAINYWSLFAGAIAGTAAFGATAGQIAGFLAQALLYTAGAVFLTAKFKDIVEKKFGRLKLPMITYPECQACECSPESVSDIVGGRPTSLLSQLSNIGLYYEKLLPTLSNFGEEDSQVYASNMSQALAGFSDANNANYKLPISKEIKLPVASGKLISASVNLPLGERINIFNARKKYFDGVNRISVSFDVNSNVGKKHYDNTLSALFNTKFETGTLLSFINLTGSSDVNYFYSAETTSGTSLGITGSSKNIVGGEVTVNYADVSNQTLGVQQKYNLSTGVTLTNQSYPNDIEYYQVVTALTVSEFFKISNLTNDNFLPAIINSCTTIINRTGIGPLTLTYTTNEYCPKDYFQDYENQYVTILQRGVDPYSPLYNNQFGLGKLFGFNNESDFIITASTRLNIPIQPISSGLAIQSHITFDNIFYESYFWNAGDGYSSFTTSNVGYYSAFDANYNINFTTSKLWNGLVGITSNISNNFYSSSASVKFYDDSEDLSGVSLIYAQNVINNQNNPSSWQYNYFSPSMYSFFESNPLPIINKTKSVMRTDRLPNSDYLDGKSWSQNAFLFQQNAGFSIYLINSGNELYRIQGATIGADVSTADIEGQFNEGEVINSLSDCNNLVSLGCYSGFGTNFGVDVNCKNNDSVELGCYILVKRALLDIGKDINTFSEWAYRFKFFFGLCRGILSQTFVNNWVNGSLYAFPIQVDVYYDKQNKPTLSKFCKDLIYFDTATNNFYYRSSPYNEIFKKFVGKQAKGLVSGAINDFVLLYPTTLMNLGMKDSVYSEINLNPSSKAYVMTELDSTSYGDTSDLVNLFVISRITDETFLSRIVSSKDNSLNQLFSRPDKRIDGDLAQLLSINSEVGVIKFSPEFYQVLPGTTNNPVNVLGVPSDPTIAVWFSSNTENLQTRDYLTPGRINFRPDLRGNAIPYEISIKSQMVPFYKWDTSTGNTIFGNQNNNWATTSTDISTTRYQSLDRLKITMPTYFQSTTSPTNTDLYNVGYIFSVDANEKYNFSGRRFAKFLVGAPFQFYFGVRKGNSAMDKFKTNYSISE